jgi:hypothetical protein
MKTILKVSVALFFISIVTAFNANGQANYSGGQAGGYAAISISLGGTSVAPGDSLITKQFDVSVYPNPLKKGQLLKGRIRNYYDNSPIRVTLIDMLGNKLMTEDIYITADEMLISLPSEKMGKGIYLITFHNSKSKITRRLILIE